MAEIMDVSRYQGTIDWEKVKASGKVDGVMIRAMGNRATLNFCPAGIIFHSAYIKEYNG